MPIGSSGFLSPFGGGASAPLIITATVSPSIGALADGDQVQDGLAASATDTANYASTAGTISSAVATVTIDGSPGTLTDVVSYNEEVAVSITVTDSAANERVFSAGTQTVAGIAPAASTAPTITGTVQPGETVTINEGTYTGTPAPTITGVLTLDSVDVSGDMSGLDYTIPSGTVGEDLTWDETASNGVAPDATQSVTETVTTTAATFGRTFTGSESLSAEGSDLRERLYDAPAISFTGWINIDAFPTASNFFQIMSIARDDTGAGQMIEISITDTGAIRSALRSEFSDSFFPVSTSPVTTGAWVHFAVVFDLVGDTATCYLDGSQENQITGVAWGQAVFQPDTSQVSALDTIGEKTLNDRFFEGSMADFAFWRRALSGAEVSAIAAGNSPRDATGGLPVWHMPMASAVDGFGSGARTIDGQMWIPKGNIEASATSPSTPIASAPTGLAAITRQRTLRLRASDAASVGVGNPVDSITLADGIEATASGAARPTYEESSGVGRLRFSGAQSMAAEVGAAHLGRGCYSIALVTSVSDAGERILSFNSETDREALSVAPRQGLVANPISPVGIDGATIDGSLRMTGGLWTGTSVLPRMNGDTLTAGTALVGVSETLGNGELKTENEMPESSDATLNIGQRDASGQTDIFWSGDLIDAIMVFGNGSLADIELIEGVLAHDNSATSILPVGHPYKTTAPTADARAKVFGEYTTTVRRSRQDIDISPASPTLVFAPNGDLIVGHDWYEPTLFDPLTPRVQFQRLIANDDIELLADFQPMYWPSLWLHTDGDLYNVASVTFGENILITKSTDNGRTWADTVILTGAVTGLPAAGSGGTAPNYERGGGIRPTYHDGHIFLAFRIEQTAGRANSREVVIWADQTSNLLDPASWSSVIYSRPDVTQTSGLTTQASCLEPHIVEDGTGQLYILERLFGVDGFDGVNQAIKIPLNWDGADITFPTWDNNAFVIDMPGGTNKFDVFEYNSKLWAAVNEEDPTIGFRPSTGHRNQLSLISTPIADLSGQPVWTEETIIMSRADVNEGLTDVEGVTWRGVQYPAGELSGDTYHFVVRTALDGAKRGHDANFQIYGSVDLSTL